MVRVPAGSAPSRPSPGCRQRRGRARTRSDIYAKTCALQVSLDWGLGKVGEQVRCPFEVSGLKEADGEAFRPMRSEEHTSELQSLMRISYAVFCLKKKNKSRSKIQQTRR